jgi:hypothetical protein
MFGFSHGEVSVRKSPVFLFTFLCAIYFLDHCLAADFLKEDLIKEEMEKLHGTWQVLVGMKNGVGEPDNPKE